MSQYLTPNEFLLFYDARRMLEYASDSGTAATDISQNLIVLRAIQGASSELDNALQKGGRYLRQTIEDICDAARVDGAAEADQKRAASIFELVAHLTYGRLVSRRGTSAEALRQLCPMYEEAQRRIADISNGVEVFDIAANINAAKPQTTPIGRKGHSITTGNRLFSVSTINPAFFGEPYCG